MEFTYTKTVEDLVECDLHRMTQTGPSWDPIRRALVTLPVVALATFGLFVAVEAVAPKTPAATVAAIVAFVLGLAFVFAPPARSRMAAELRRYYEQQGPEGLVGRITLILTDESLTTVTEKWRSEVRWREMKGMEVVGDVTYIYFSGVAGTSIPRRGFDREEEYYAVRDFAAAKLGYIPT